MIHTQIRKTYKYRLYRCDKKDRKLRHMIFVASTVWNHMLALQRRYYRLTGKYIRLNQMNEHVLKLRKTLRYSFWKDLHSQACQDVCRRIDDAYQRFFNKLVQRPPKFKKARKYRSFTFPQKGFKVEGYAVVIGGTKYKFVKHREMNGQVKTLTIKRDVAGHLWLIFSVIEEISIEESSTGKIGGFDFGLKTFLTDDEGRQHTSPLFFTRELNSLRKLNRRLSKKAVGSRRFKRARQALAKTYIGIANKRRDHHFKLAHELCDEYSTLVFEDLNLRGMKAMWGRKVSDLGFSSFMSILEWVAFKRGKSIIRIDRFTPTSQICSGCGQRHSLTLRDRTLKCDCGLVIDRDHNAAINIKRAGASACYQSASKTQVRLRRRDDGRGLLQNGEEVCH